MQSLKAATLDDTPMLAKLGAQTFYDTFRPHNSEEDMQAYIAKSYTEKAVSENLKNPHIHYALLLENNQAVGYIKLWLHAAHAQLSGSTIELEKIYVLQSNLSTGAGKKLMDYAIAFAKEHHAKYLFLGVWDQNERAVSFYRKAGFTIFATRSFTLGSRICDDYMMKLDL
jgi:ribosomal protein S18 acetylase RimI-like enzyme